MQGTGGSSAIANSYLQYRGAGAAARAMLVAAAADAWKVPAAEVTVSKGVLAHRLGQARHLRRDGRGGEPAAGAGEAGAEGGPPDSPSSARTGPTPRVDSPAKCNGSAVYTIDVKLPGLLTAVIAFPPSFGAKVVSFDATAAKQVKGVTDVVQVPEGVAVVATGTWAALQGRRALQRAMGRVGERPARLATSCSPSIARKRASRASRSRGRPPERRRRRPTVKTVEAVYEFPFLAHAAMEPMNCVAWLHDGMLETWSGHQFPSFDQMFAAKAAGLPLEKVRLHTVYSGGSFGRRANGWSDFTVAAVNVAKAIDGRAPVRLQFTPRRRHRRRLLPADERACRQGRPRRQGRHRRVEARHRRPVDRRRHADGGDGQGGHRSDLGRRRHRVALRAADDRGRTALAESLAVKPLWWRSVGNTHTAYVMETMMDELAAAAGKDPLAFRLALLEQQRDAPPAC